MSSEQPARDIPVFCTIPNWGIISGVDVFTTNLLTTLKGKGFEATIISTGKPSLCTLPDVGPQGIKHWRAPLQWYDSPLTEWRWASERIREGTPSIYLPGYDWFSAWQSVALPPSVSLVGVLHSDDDCYYEFARTIGPFCDAIVAVSDSIATQAAERFPELAAKLTTIAYGIPYSLHCPVRSVAPENRLNIIYAGRLFDFQKRVLDLPKIAEALDARGIPFELHIVGDGPERTALEERMQRLIAARKVHLHGQTSNVETRAMLARSDAFILTSEFEGLPVSLLEAMSQGCVPVVTDIRSGIPQLVEHGRNGFIVPVGGIVGFADRLAELQRNAALREQMSRAAHETIARAELRDVDMSEKYVRLFRSLRGKVNPLRPGSPHAIRPNLPGCRIMTSWRLPRQVRRVLMIAQGNLHGLRKEIVRRIPWLQTPERVDMPVPPPSPRLKT